MEATELFFQFMLFIIKQNMNISLKQELPIYLSLHFDSDFIRGTNEGPLGAL